MKEEIQNIKEDIRDIKDNHLKHIETDIKILMKNFTEVATNQKWLMKFFWLVAGASVGSLIASVFSLILK